MLASKFVPFWIVVLAAIVVLLVALVISFVLQGIGDSRAADEAERAAGGVPSQPQAEA